MRAFDQRNVRNTPEGFTALGDNVLCGTCGQQTSCAARMCIVYAEQHKGVSLKVERCKTYVPVIGFNGMIGTDKTFNTFRRGAGCYRRMPVGTPVRFFDLANDVLCHGGMVIETHLNTLGNLLEQHAAFNHMLRDGNYPDAETRLLKVLVREYGRNYAALDQEYSVIYCEPGV